MTHLNLNQTTSSIEVVASSIIDKLYKLAQNPSLDANSTIQGNLQCTHAYEDAVTYLLNKFPNLQINVTSGAYLRFIDSAVQAICAANWGDGTGITTVQASVVASLNSKFNANATIISFNELAKFINVKTLITNEFSDCSKLQSIDLSNITTLGVRSFLRCSALETICNLSAITDFPESCFDSCSKLSMDLSANNVLTVAKYAFRFSKLTNINLSNCTSILNGAFYKCSQLNIVLNMPNLTILASTLITTQNEYGAFNGSGITGIENLGTIQYIPIGYPQYDRSQFGYCSNLRYVKLPSTLLGIGDTSFIDCKALEYVVSNATTPPTLNGTKVFYNTNLTFKIYVPDSSVSAYKSATNWSAYASRIFSLTQFAIDFPNG